MTIRFAAATTGANAVRSLPASKPIARGLIARSMERVGNDNGPRTSGFGSNNDVLQAALRHFAEHGMSAARVARAQAQTDQDRQTYDWWLDITRTLDRRLAAELERTAPDLA